ncbi:hypothetical protein Tco_0934236 [Tanacetum coccineum]
MNNLSRRQQKQRKGTSIVKLIQKDACNHINKKINNFAAQKLNQRGLRAHDTSTTEELKKFNKHKHMEHFIPRSPEDRERASELAAGSSQATITNSAKVGSSKRDAEAELVHEGSKKQTTNETSGSVKEQPEEEETELSQEDLQQMMMVVPVEEVYVEALQVKYRINDWEVYIKDSRKY